MSAKRNRLEDLTRLLASTAAEEINCDEVLEHVAAYVEFDEKAKPLTDKLAEVQQHLEICPCCLEEFQALRQLHEDWPD